MVAVIAPKIGLAVDTVVEATVLSHKRKPHTSKFLQVNCYKVCIAGICWQKYIDIICWQCTKHSTGSQLVEECLDVWQSWLFCVPLTAYGQLLSVWHSIGPHIQATYLSIILHHSLSGVCAVTD